MDGGEDDNDGEISYSSDEPPRPDRGFNSPFDAKHSCRHWKVKTILTMSQLLSSSQLSSSLSYPGTEEAASTTTKA